MSEKDSKTEEPTGKRIQQSLSKGQFAKAEEVGMVFLMIAFFLMILFLLRSRAVDYAQFGRHIFENLDTDILTRDSIAYWMSVSINAILVFLAPFFAASMVAAIVAGGIQTGFKLTPGVFGTGLEKLNPVNGFSKIFSIRSLVQGGVDFLKVVAIILVIWGVIMDLTDDPVFHNPTPIQHLPEFIFDNTVLMFFRVIALMTVIAIVHYAYQKWQNHEDMKMTKQEVKDERKQSDGDPLVKQAQRKMALRIARQQMLSGVETSDVVVTNPTHYAVALKYERGKDMAPVIVAKGEDAFAMRIKEKAAVHEVPVVENVWLARTLYRLGRVGQPIPAELFQAVADVLAYVYRTYRYYFYRLKSRRLS